MNRLDILRTATREEINQLTDDELRCYYRELNRRMVRRRKIRKREEAKRKEGKECNS